MTEDLQALLASGASPDALLDRLPAAYAAAIDCDRCVLFLRDPHSRRARATPRPEPSAGPGAPRRRPATSPRGPCYETGAMRAAL